MTDSLRNQSGQIITFYSYKGGTGRSMALANVAWILASNGKKVLVVDWDLEAPGLHEYFRPFLGEDPDLESTDGLIDMMVSFAGQAIQLKELPEDLGWYEEQGNFLRYATPIQWKFAADGRLDFLPAGRQSAAYASRVNRFDWIGFYERLGGQRFMAAFRDMVRREYEYVLIDSRTGVSDTAGICTVQLPDCLVVAFTLNRQGIRGASEVASSINANRGGSDVTRAIRIFPVPMRLDNAEKQALDESISDVRTSFRRFLDHLPESKHNEYWRSISVPYIPFYAYGELLAPLADQPSVSHSLIGPMSAITHHITNGSVNGMPDLSESDRAAVRKRYRELLSSAKLSTTKLLEEPEMFSPKSDELSEIFLSYSHEDSEFVETFVRRLQHSSVRTFSHRDLSSGENSWQATEEAIRRASAACVFIGRSAIGSSEKPRWQNRELYMLLERASRVETGSPSSFRLIPVLLPGARPSEMPPGLMVYQWVDIRESSAWAKGVDEIVRSVRWSNVEPSREYNSLSPAQSPYPGLRPFSEFDSPVFFGRDAVIDRLLQELAEKRCAILVGPPGSGKSSLIRAGIIPRLTAGTGRTTKTIEPLILRPGGEPLENLLQSLASTDSVVPRVQGKIMKGDSAVVVSPSLRKLIESIPSDVVIIVDQLDELSLSADPKKMREFLGTLDDLFQTTTIRILVSSRSDYLQSLRVTLNIDFPQFLRSNPISLDPLSRTELMGAIRAPAELTGRTFEPGLVERIADDFAGVYSLPILQLFLSTLWERARGKVVTHSDYQEIGGVQSFVGDSVDRVLSGFTLRTREIAVRVLLRLVSPQRKTRTQLLESEFTPEEQDAIRQLTAEGILRQTEINDTSYVSLSHDALIQHSRILQTQMKEAETFLIWKSRFATYFSDWESLEQNNDSLLRGSRLREAEEFLLSSYRDYFTRAEAGYIAQSRRFETRAKRRGLQNAIVTVGLLILVVFFIVMTFVRR